MKYVLLLLTAALLSGCDTNQQLQQQIDIVRKSNEEVKMELASLKADINKQQSRVRWATVDRFEVLAAISKKIAEFSLQARKKENLTQKQTQDLAYYEDVQQELSSLTVRTLPTRTLRVPGQISSPPVEPEVEAAKKRLEEAKAPVAQIVDRLDKLSSKYHSQYSIEKILAVCCKDRYDLVLDQQMSKVLY